MHLLTATTPPEPGPLGVSSWQAIDQNVVDQFAEVTQDLQWIHVDPVRAKHGPFGSTVAHGFLTLSLIPAFARELYRFDTAGAVVNYGTDRVRFPGPVHVDSEIRVHALLTAARVRPGGVLYEIEHTVETKNSSRPGCVATLLTLVLESEK